MTSFTKKIFYCAFFVTIGLLLVILTFTSLFGIMLAGVPTGEFFGVLGIIFIILGVVYLFYNSPNDYYVANNSEPDIGNEVEEPRQFERQLPPREYNDEELGRGLWWRIGRGKP
jgi:cadmium resistance protein CadD (predicted permease)